MKIYIYLSDDKWTVSEKKSGNGITNSFKSLKKALLAARKLTNDNDISILEFGKWINISKSKHIAKANNSKTVAITLQDEEDVTEMEQPRKVKLRKVYITVRKDKEHKILGWFIVDKKSPVDYEFENKVKALEYVRENYEDVMVLVQNDLAKFQYTIVLENNEVISFKSKGKEDSDVSSTTTDIKKVFKYDETSVKTEKTFKRSIFHKKHIVHPSCPHIEADEKNRKILDQIILIVKHKGDNHFSVLPYDKDDEYEKRDEYENGLYLKGIKKDVLSQPLGLHFKTKALALAYIETKYNGYDVFLITGYNVKFINTQDGYAKQMADPNSDAHIMAHNENMTKNDLHYFETRKAQYYGYEFPAFNRTLLWGSAFAIVSLIVSILAFMLNAGVGISRSYYAIHITANRWEFLIPAFLLLIWPVWMTIRLFITSDTVNKIQNGFARKPKYTHKYFMKRIKIIRIIHTLITALIEFISVGWLIAFISTSSGLLTELSYISMFVLIKILFIIIPKTFVLFMALREAIAAKKWANEHDFAKSTVLLAYLYFEKRTSTSHAIIGKYDFNGVSGTNKILTDFYTYKQRGVTMDYLFKVTARTLTDKERAMIDKRTIAYKKSLEDEAAIYARIVDNEGRIIWN